MTDKEKLEELKEIIENYFEGEIEQEDFVQQIIETVGE